MDWERKEAHIIFYLFSEVAGLRWAEEKQKKGESCIVLPQIRLLLFLFLWWAKEQHKNIIEFFAAPVGIVGLGERLEASRLSFPRFIIIIITFAHQGLLNVMVWKAELFSSKWKLICSRQCSVAAGTRRSLLFSPSCRIKNGSFIVPLL